MSKRLFSSETAKYYDAAYTSGFDHKYPNENVVRLETLYFNRNGGCVLEYGFGYGTSAIHFAECGYLVEGIDIAQSALELTNRKLIDKEHLRQKITLRILREEESEQLPYPDASFDYIVANQTIHHLGSISLIAHLLDEFHRILKPEGKMIATVLGPSKAICRTDRKISENVYEYLDANGPGEACSLPMKYFVFRNEEEVRGAFSKFVIDEIGWFGSRYCVIDGYHFVVLCRKPAL